MKPKTYLEKIIIGYLSYTWVTLFLEWLFWFCFLLWLWNDYFGYLSYFVFGIIILVLFFIVALEWLFWFCSFCGSRMIILVLFFIVLFGFVRDDGCLC